MGGQFPACRAQFFEPDVKGGDRLPAAQRVPQGGSFRGDSGNVKEGDGAGRGGGRPESLELVLLGNDRQSGDCHRIVLGEGAQQMAENRVEVVGGREFLGNVPESQNAGGQPVLVEMQPDGRRPPGNGAADVEQVGVALGARSNHRVREADGIRLAPGDLLSEPGGLPALVGGAGPGRDRPHGCIGPHLTG